MKKKLLQIDIATVVGLVIAFAAILIGMALGGGSLVMYMQATAAIIVIGGTFGAVFMCFSLKDNINIVTKVGLKAFFTSEQDYKKQIDQIIFLAKVVRRDGLLSLEKELDKVDDSFLRKGIQLTVDGVDSNKLTCILETEIEELEARHKKGISWFATAGGFAPTLGIIGTVIGLIIVLGNLKDPDELGRGIAAAFLTTLYGICMANLFFIPTSSKLKFKSSEEVRMKQLMLKGVLGIQSGANPRLIEEELMAFAPPEKLLEDKDKQKAADEKIADKNKREAVNKKTEDKDKQKAAGK